MGVLWFPEPPHEPETDFSISATEFLGPGPESSDSEEDPPPIAYDGLEPTPESGWATLNNLYSLVPNDEDSNDSEDDTQSEAPASTMDEITQSEIDLWAGPASDIDLGEEKEALVKAAMAGFNLPLSAVPPWAAYVPEEQWQQEIKIHIAKMKDVK